ncbi:Uncharacterised protein [uncultured archaeon]|nr:Uncharacterised protein [uncultured archaeon]
MFLFAGGLQFAEEKTPLSDMLAKLIPTKGTPSKDYVKVSGMYCVKANGSFASLFYDSDGDGKFTEGEKIGYVGKNGKGTAGEQDVRRIVNLLLGLPAGASEDATQKAYLKLAGKTPMETENRETDKTEEKKDVKELLAGNIKRWSVDGRTAIANGYYVETDGQYATLFKSKDGKNYSEEDTKVGFFRAEDKAVSDGIGDSELNKMWNLLNSSGKSGTKTGTKTGTKKNVKGIKYHKVKEESGYNPNELSMSLSGVEYLKQFDQVFHFVYGKFDARDQTGDVAVKGYTASKEDAEAKFKEAEGIMKACGYDISSMDMDKAKVFLEIVRSLAQGKTSEEITASYKEVSLKDAAANVNAGIANYIEQLGGGLSGMTLAPTEETKKEAPVEKTTVPIWAIIENDDFLKMVWGILSDEEKELVEAHFGKEDENLQEDQVANRMELLVDDGNGNLMVSKVILETKIGELTGYYYPLNSGSIEADPRVAERLSGYDKKEYSKLIEKGKTEINGAVFFSVDKFLEQVPEKKGAKIEEKTEEKEETYFSRGGLGKLVKEDKALRDKYYVRNSVDGGRRNVNEINGVKDALENEFTGKKFTAQQVMDFVVKFDGGAPVKKEEKKVEKKEEKKQEVKKEQVKVEPKKEEKKVEVKKKEEVKKEEKKVEMGKEDIYKDSTPVDKVETEEKNNGKVVVEEKNNVPVSGKNVEKVSVPWAEEVLSTDYDAVVSACRKTKEMKGMSEDQINKAIRDYVEAVNRNAQLKNAAEVYSNHTAKGFADLVSSYYTE